MKGILISIMSLLVMCLAACGAKYSEDGLTCSYGDWTVSVGSPPNREQTKMLNSGGQWFQLPEEYGEVIAFEISISATEPGVFEIGDVELLGPGGVKGELEPWKPLEITHTGNSLPSTIKLQFSVPEGMEIVTLRLGACSFKFQ